MAAFVYVFQLVVSNRMLFKLEPTIVEIFLAYQPSNQQVLFQLKGSSRMPEQDDDTTRMCHKSGLALRR